MKKMTCMHILEIGVSPCSVVSMSVLLSVYEDINQDFDISRSNEVIMIKFFILHSHEKPEMSRVMQCNI